MKKSTKKAATQKPAATIPAEALHLAERMAKLEGKPVGQWIAEAITSNAEGLLQAELEAVTRS